jgi:hypothetical protein
MSTVFPPRYMPSMEYRFSRLFQTKQWAASIESCPMGRVFEAKSSYKETLVV